MDKEEVDIENAANAAAAADHRDTHDECADNCEDSPTGNIREPLLKSKSRVNNSSQIAIIGAKICPIESLDYEILENDLIKQDWRSRKKVQIFQYILLKWTLAFLIGLITGVVALFNNLAVENIADSKLLLCNNLMLEGKEQEI